MHKRLTRLELLITSYYNIVKRTMIDMVPKAIMYTLVEYVTTSVNHLFLLHCQIMLY